MYHSGETAYLCNQCSKDNFEIDPATKIGRSKRDVGSLAAYTMAGTTVSKSLGTSAPP